MPCTTACICDPQDAHIRVSQVIVEPLRLPNQGNLRVSQVVIEVLKLPNPSGHLRVTQAVIELPKASTIIPPAGGSNQLYEA